MFLEKGLFPQVLFQLLRSYCFSKLFSGACFSTSSLSSIITSLTSPPSLLPGGSLWLSGLTCHLGERLRTVTQGIQAVCHSGVDGGLYVESLFSPSAHTPLNPRSPRSHSAVHHPESATLNDECRRPALTRLNLKTSWCWCCV